MLDRRPQQDVGGEADAPAVRGGLSRLRLLRHAEH
jgi:hypothetical protein